MDTGSEVSCLSRDQLFLMLHHHTSERQSKGTMASFAMRENSNGTAPCRRSAGHIESCREENTIFSAVRSESNCGTQEVRPKRLFAKTFRSRTSNGCRCKFSSETILAKPGRASSYPTEVLIPPSAKWRLPLAPGGRSNLPRPLQWRLILPPLFLD